MNNVQSNDDVRNASLVYSKKALRASIKSRLRAMTYDRAELASKLFANLSTIDRFNNARTVGVFVDFQTETPTRPFLPQLFTGRDVAGVSFTRVVGVPFCVGPEMRFYRLRPPQFDAESGRYLFDDLTPGAYGILEPREELRNDPANIVAPEEFDVLITPGLAFTRDGNRLGRGAGYYDRYLPLLSPTALVIGLAFDEQLVEELPIEPHDKTLPVVVTPTRVYYA